MTDQEFVLSIYPKVDISRAIKYFIVMDYATILSVEPTRDKAWEVAANNVRLRMLRKLEL